MPPGLVPGVQTQTLVWRFKEVHRCASDVAGLPIPGAHVLVYIYGHSIMIHWHPQSPIETNKICLLRAKNELR